MNDTNTSSWWSSTWNGIWNVAKTSVGIVRKAAPRMLSFSLSASISVTGIEISRQKANTDQEKIDNSHASTLATTGYYTLVTCSIIHLLYMHNYLKKKRGGLSQQDIDDIESGEAKPIDSIIEPSDEKSVTSINQSQSAQSLLVPIEVVEIATVMRNGAIITLPYYLISATFFLASEPILTDLFQQPQAPSAIAQKFFIPSTATLLVFSGHMIASQVYFAFDLEDYEMAFSLTGLVIGGACGYAFSFQLDSGVAGITYGWLVGESLATMLSILYAKRNKLLRKIDFVKESFRWHEHDKQQMIELFKGGLPYTKTFVSELSVSLLLNNWLINLLCESKATSAVNYVIILDSIEMLQHLALAMTTSGLISFEKGRAGGANIQKLQHIAKVGLGLSLTWVGIQVLLAAFNGGTYSKLINSQNDTELNQLIYDLLWVYVGKILCDAWRTTMQMSLVGIDDFQVSTNLSVGGMWMGLAIAAGLAAKGAGVVKSLLGFTGGLFFSNVFLTMHWNQKFKDPASESVVQKSYRRLSEGLSNGYQALSSGCQNLFRRSPSVDRQPLLTAERKLDSTPTSSSVWKCLGFDR